jgi:hypothetical protein
LHDRQVGITNADLSGGLLNTRIFYPGRKFKKTPAKTAMKPVFRLAKFQKNLPKTPPYARAGFVIPPETFMQNSEHDLHELPGGITNAA